VLKVKKEDIKIGEKYRYVGCGPDLKKIGVVTCKRIDHGCIGIEEASHLIPMLENLEPLEEEELIPAPMLLHIQKTVHALLESFKESNSRIAKLETRKAKLLDEINEIEQELSKEIIMLTGMEEVRDVLELDIVFPDLFGDACDQ
jgi:hypothetical protein